MKKSSHLLLAAILAVLLLSSGAAEELSSAYTKLDPKACKDVTPLDAGGYGGVSKCKGYAGIEVRVAEGDLRMFVSYGADAAKQTAAEQTLPQFNTIGDTLEWRLADGKPFATILRYCWDSDNGEGSTLVVTKLGKMDACHVGYVSATGNPNANVLARTVADTLARGFDCANDRVYQYGPDGNRTDQATRGRSSGVSLDSSSAKQTRRASRIASSGVSSSSATMANSSPPSRPTRSTSRRFSFSVAATSSRVSRPWHGRACR
jgi:hypothetical protein